MLFLNKTFDNLKGKQGKSIEIEILQTKACRLNFRIKNSIKIAMTHTYVESLRYLLEILRI